MGLIVLPYFAPKCLDPYEWGRVLDSDGFLSQLSVELFGIYPEGLIIIIIIIIITVVIIIIIIITNLSWSTTSADEVCKFR